MKIIKQPRALGRSYDSYEEWSAAFLPKGGALELSEEASVEPPSAIGKMIAASMLQRFSSFKKDGKRS